MRSSNQQMCNARLASWIVFLTLVPLAAQAKSVAAVTYGPYRARTQTTPSLEAEWKSAMDLLKEGNRNAIPALERLFQRSTDDDRKRTIAALLVTLAVPDDSYFDFLAGAAREAVESDILYPLKLDAAGQSVRGEYSEEFLNWCDENGVGPGVAAIRALRSYPSAVAALGRTGDWRAFALMLRGLESPNYMVVAQAAAGLGRIGDSRAISSIVEAAAVSPKELALAFARALVYFEDPEADAAARRLIDDDAVFQELRSAAKSEKAKIHSDKALFERN